MTNNFFEKMVLQIPMEATDVVEYYALPLIDQELLLDEARTFVSTKLAAFRAIKMNTADLFPAATIETGVPIVTPPVPPHKSQLKSSYSPKPQPGIRRLHSNVDFVNQN